MTIQLPTIGLSYKLIPEHWFTHTRQYKETHARMYQLFGYSESKLTY